MARRGSKRKTTRRRRKQGVSLLNVAETAALANVATSTLFNVNAVDFLMGGDGFGQGNQITLRELFKPIQSERQVVGTSGSGMARRQTYGTVQAGTTFGLIQSNLEANWVSGAAGMILVPLTFKGIKTLGRPAISKINTLLRKAGIASTVKV